MSFVDSEFLTQPLSHAPAPGYVSQPSLPDEESRTVTPATDDPEFCVRMEQLSTLLESQVQAYADTIDTIDQVHASIMEDIALPPPYTERQVGNRAPSPTRFPKWQFVPPDRPSSPSLVPEWQMDKKKRPVRRLPLTIVGGGRIGSPVGCTTRKLM